MQTSKRAIVSNLINGVSLTLRQADAGKDLTVTVQADTEPATAAVTEFVGRTQRR